MFFKSSSIGKFLAVVIDFLLTLSLLFPQLSRLPTLHYQSRRGIIVLDSLLKKWEDLKFPPNKIVYTKDKVSRARNIIVYRSDDIRLYILSTGFFVLLFAFGNVLLMIHLLRHGTKERIVLPEDTDEFEDVEYQDIYDLDSSPFAWFLILMMGASVVFLLHIIHKRFVIRMYYDESKKLFTCVTYNPLLPWTTRSFPVKAGSATVRTLSKMENTFNPNRSKFSWTCKLNGKKMIVNDLCFKYPVYFNVLFGYEDPNAIAKLSDSDETAEQIFRRRSVESD